MARKRGPRPGSRDRLVQAAEDLFDRRGFHATGIDAIAAAADSTKMTLYHHFDTKEALILEVLAKRDRTLRAWFEAALAGAGASPAERIAALFDAVGDHVRDAAFRGSLFDKAAHEFPGADSAVRKAAVAHKAWLFGRVRDLAAAAGAADPVTLAAGLFLLIDGAITAASVTGDRSAARRAKTAAEMLLGAATAR
jgi:AcrR family transcriptional regulator